MELTISQSVDIKPNVAEIKSLLSVEQLPNPLLESYRKANYNYKEGSEQNGITESRTSGSLDTNDLHGVCSNCNIDFSSESDKHLEIAEGADSIKVSNANALEYVYESRGKENVSLFEQSVFLKIKRIAMCRQCSSSLTKLYKALKQFSQLCHLQSSIADKLRELESLHTNIYKESLTAKLNDNVEDAVPKNSINVKIESADVFYEEDEDNLLHSGYASDVPDNNNTNADDDREIKIHRLKRKRRSHHSDYVDPVSSINSKEDDPDSFNSDSEEEEFKPLRMFKKNNKIEKIRNSDCDRNMRSHPDPDGDNDELACKECSKTFTRKHHLSRHLTQVHSKSTSNQSTEVTENDEKLEGDAETSRTKKRNMFKSGESDTCTHCSKVFQNPRSLQRHMKIHTDEDNEKLTCNLCMKKFTQENHLVRHVRNVHKTSFSSQRTESKIENEAIDDKSSEKQEKSNNNNIFSCNLCEKSFLRKDRLTEHLLSHSTNAPFSCEICSKTFLQKRGLLRHKILHSDTNPYFCAICNKYFSRSDHLKRHMEAHKTGGAKSSKSVEPAKEIECEVCGKHFKQRFQLKLHKLTHTNEKPWSCDICGRGFKLPSTLQAHRKVHSDERKYCCSVCGKTFKRNAPLKEHEALHFGLIPKPYKCIVENCGKAFRHKSHLNDHIATHTGEKGFICELCGAAFSRRTKLRAHQVIHSGEKSFVCELCPAAFSRRDNLRSHHRTVHLNDPSAKRPKGPSKKSLPEQNVLPLTHPHQMACDILFGIII